MDAAEARERREEAAARYRPERIDLLLVAEAPPGALDRYFYFDDVPTQDSLFRYVARGILGEEPTRANKAELLTKLRDRNVFLIDLKTDPVDGTPSCRERRRSRRAVPGARPAGHHPHQDERLRRGLLAAEARGAAGRQRTDSLPGKRPAEEV